MLEDRIKTGRVERLDRFHVEELDCDVELLRQPGVHLVTPERRRRAGWGGYTIPIIAISTNAGGIISCRMDLAESVRQELAHVADQPLGDVAFERLKKISRRATPHAYSLSGYVLYCEPGHFRPDSLPAERLDRADQRGMDLRRRFDGEIFVVGGVRGEIASWAAIKLKSNDVWEIAVVTEAAYRGRGYAKQVVSAATQHILESGRLALYVHDRTNHASAKVCRSLGYIEYAEEYFCEY